jgi:hypothetical protein
MTDSLPALLARLEAADAGSRAFWCHACGYVAVVAPHHHSTELRSSLQDCNHPAEWGTPDDCAAAIRAQAAQAAEKEG